MSYPPPMVPGMHRLGWIVAICLAGCAHAPAPAYPDGAVPLHGIEVLDGDTLRAGEVVYRLAGINANEVAHGGGTRDECLGPEARHRLGELVANGAAAVTLGTELYGRTLAEVIAADGTFVNLLLVQEGLALAEDYGEPGPHQDLLAAAASAAKVQRVGMWGPAACGALAAVTPGLSVEVHARADALTGTPEYVVVRGPPGTALGGWVLRDASASHRFTFPEGTVLPPSGELRVVTGCEAEALAAEGELLWCESRGVWNDDGDTAFLLDAAGAIVATVDYP